MQDWWLVGTVVVGILRGWGRELRIWGRFSDRQTDRHGDGKGIGTKCMMGMGTNCCTRVSLSLSLHFNGHFPRGPGLANTRMSPFWILLELRMMEVVMTTGAIRCAKLQSNSRHQQTNTQFLYRPDALPVAQPIMSEHWRKASVSL